MIKIEKLCKSFNGKDVLKDLDIEIKDGEIFVILGKSGQGKSVLLKLFMGLIKPDSGKVFLDDDDMATLHGKDLYDKLKNTSMVFQGGALFDSMTVEENISFYLNEHGLVGGEKIKKSDIKKLALETLKKVGLEGTENLYPSSLSGGMKKRLAFGRSLIYKPKYIFYDEPTTGLDPLTAKQIAQQIVMLHKELKKETTVVVSHDIYTTLSIADRIALIDDGKIIIVEEPEKFMLCDHPTIKLFYKMIGNNLDIIKDKEL